MRLHGSSRVAVIVLIFCFSGSVLALRKVDAVRGKDTTLEDILYLPSGKAIRRMSLGYSSLLADIYWTRAVQYFGSRHQQRAMRYDLLYPLLDITTDLDPQLIVTYQYGAVFLSQQPPEGAGQPDKAIALVEKGIQKNPDYWRLYFTLGFIQYMDRRDYRAAQDAFEKGSEIPGAQPWMKVMAARMAERHKDVDTAIALWQGVHESSSDPSVKATAVSHLESIRADLDMMELDRRIKLYHDRTGEYPVHWQDLIRLGFLRGIPTDPQGDPYVLLQNGVIGVEHPEKFPFLTEWRYQ